MKSGEAVSFSKKDITTVFFLFFFKGTEKEKVVARKAGGVFVESRYDWIVGQKAGEGNK